MALLVGMVFRGRVLRGSEICEFVSTVNRLTAQCTFNKLKADLIRGHYILFSTLADNIYASSLSEGLEKIRYEIR